MSTDDASSSSTNRRLWRTRAESVWIFIPSSTLREHAGTSTREPSSSTTHTRHTFTGVRLSSWHSVGVSIARRRHASRMVVPARASTCRPSMVTRTSGIEHLELGQPRGDGVGRGLAQTTNRRVAHRLSDVAQEHDVRAAVAVATLEHSLQDLLLALRAHAARHALAARLVAEEAGDAEEDLPHVRGVVEQHHRARAERGADAAHSLEAQRHVDLLRREERPRRAAKQDRLHRSPRRQAAGHLDEATQGRPHRHLIDARAQDLPRDAEEPRVGELAADDLEHVDQRLHVVGQGRLAEQPHLDRERRLVARLAALALDGVEERSLLTADVRTGAAPNLDLKDRKSTRLNSSHDQISYAVFCL